MIELTPIQKEINRIRKNYKNFDQNGLSRFDLRMFVFNIELIDEETTPELYQEIISYNKKMKEEIEIGDEARNTLFDDVAISIRRRTNKIPSKKEINEELHDYKKQVYEYLIGKGSKKFKKIMKKFF